MNIAPDWTLFVQLINFLILFGVLKWKFFGPVMGILKNREDAIKSDLEKAAKSREEAMKLKNEYEDKLKDAAKEAREIIQNATQDGEKVKAELIEKGREEVLRMKEESQKQIQMEREKAILSLRQEVSGLSIKIASKLIKRNLDEATNRALISEFIGELNS